MPYKKNRIPVPNPKDVLRWDGKKAKPIAEKLWNQLVEGEIDPENYTALEVYCSDKDYYTHFKYETFRPHLKDFAKKVIDLKNEKGTGPTEAEAEEAEAEAEAEEAEEDSKADDDEDYKEGDESSEDEELEEAEEEEKEDEEASDLPPLSEMAGKKAASVGKKKAAKAAKKKPADEEEDSDVEELNEGLSQMSVKCQQNNTIDIIQYISLLTRVDGSNLRALFVTIQGLAPGDLGVLDRVKRAKYSEKLLSFDWIKESSELDAKDVMRDIYKKSTHVTTSILQEELYKYQKPHPFRITLIEPINAKVAIDCHGRRSKSIKPCVTGRKLAPSLTFIMELKRQNEFESELEVHGINATHSTDDEEDEDMASPNNKRARAPPAPPARSGLFGLGLAGL